MFVVYILYSSKLDRYYIGHTKNIENRLMLHNAGKVRSTKNGISWVIKHIENFNNRNDTYRRELQIKKYKGGEAFQKLLKK
ncbi:MAG: GIY-YIG nuclease family protein [Patescibacteria group bacterium]|jgi:putative endonuclease